MAEVRDRAQLILVAGLALAVLFVVLALLVNTAIYTENVATRGVDPGGEALEYRGAAVSTVGGLIDAENADSSHGSVSDVEYALGDGVSEVDESLYRQFASRGASTSLDNSSIETTEGVLIRETEVDGFANWTEGVNQSRAFVVDFDPEEMPTVNDPQNESFRIDLDDRELYVYVENGNLSVATDDDPEDPICTTDDWESDETIEFDVTAERFDGEPCRFDWPDPEEITFANGGNASGTYSLTVDPDDDASEVVDDLTDLGVNATEAVYDVRVNLRYDSKDLSYESTVRIAPGEPNE